MAEFSYNEAFQRNLGLLTLEEQEVLRQKTIAIPGMGGVGGIHFLSLVRQGFEKFKIADPDVFEIKNFNRQIGANMNSIGRKKIEVMKEMALQINPNCHIETTEDRVHEQNLYAFLKGVDLAVDGIDAFEVDARRAFFNKALELGIPVITAGPIGFSTAFLIFMPGGPSFDDYFAVNDDTPYMRKMISFLVGLTPALLQRTYMKKVSLKEKRGPSSVGSVDLCAGVVVIYAIKIFLNKGPIKAVPYYHQFDVMRDKYVVKRLWLGNRNPFQKLKMKLIERMMPD
ncbi:MAG: ThiF family adenylyltransferase [bacterium]|nr:ThiF family adenylyltransferase [bacterium]